MKSNTKKRGLSTTQLRKKLVRGDQKEAARRVDCHLMTVQQALDGEPGPKREAVIDALLQIVEERKTKQEKLNKL